MSETPFGASSALVVGHSWRGGWGVVWGGVGWFRVCAPPLLSFVFSFGILVWELHSVAPEEGGLRLVWPGVW